MPILCVFLKPRCNSTEGLELLGKGVEKDEIIPSPESRMEVEYKWPAKETTLVVEMVM